MSDEQIRTESAGILAKIILAVVTVLACAAIVALAVLGARWLIKTKPQPQRRARGESVALVQTVALERGQQRVFVRATGTVVPARQVALKPQVSGRVVSVSDRLVPGAAFADGETLLQIEPLDYELALATRKAELVQSQFDQTLEMGHQDVARNEWEMLADKEKATELDRELMLRKPHLEAAQARVRSAEVGVEKARLDLARTTVRAPFNLTVREKHVDLGDQASPQTPVLTAVGTDEYWVEISLPTDRLRWLTLPEGDNPGSRAEVTVRFAGGDQQVWQGELIRRRPDLELNGRMARLIVRVPQPLTQNEALPLLIGSFVHVSLEGPTLEAVFALPRAAVHDGNSVWLRGEDGRLVVRRIEPLFSSDEAVFVRAGLDEGDQLVTSDLPNPVPGMKIARPGEARRGERGGPPAEKPGGRR
jgi:RND family efflux transporter MFP subunit